MRGTWRGGVGVVIVAVGLGACEGGSGREGSERNEMAMPSGAGFQPAALAGGTLDPTTVPKYQAPLVVPPAMPRKSVLTGAKGKKTDYYEIALRQFQQNILPPGMPATTVWSYGAVALPGTVAQGGSFHYPAFTLETKYQQAVRVSWRNELVKDPVDCFYTVGGPLKPDSCDFLPHLLPVAQTLHWANPLGNCGMGSTAPECAEPYTGPVPASIHVHGADTFEDSDGHPEAWYLPAASNLPAGASLSGPFFAIFKAAAEARQGKAWKPGEAVLDYPNDMRAGTIWYHDHSMGMTRLNVYAGPAGFYLLRGGPSEAMMDLAGKPAVLPGPAPALGDLPGVEYFEIPLAIQDRSFNADGSLFYPDNREFFEGMQKGDLAGLGVRSAPSGGSDVSGIWNPEFFGNTMVVNGRTWPYLTVKSARYRFRLLNGTQGRFLYLKLVTATDPSDPMTWQDVVGAVTQIGADGGLLPAPVPADKILLGPAERADVIVDFAAVPLPAGAGLYLVNIGPDEPFGGGVPGVDFAMAHPGTTGQVMQFRVVASNAPDKTTPPAQLVLAARAPLPAPSVTRQISLNEADSATETFCVDAAGLPVPITTRPCPDGVSQSVCTDGTAYVVEPGDTCSAGTKVDVTAAAFGPAEALLGTVENGSGVPLKFHAALTENPALGAVEEWEIYNFTADAHPIHIHLVQFEVVNRQLLEVDTEGMTVQPAVLLPGVLPPEPAERGVKDTFISYPGQVTRVRARFNRQGLYVWHCHIVEHEDNEMMRPYCVGTSAACDKHNSGAMSMSTPAPMPGM